MVEYLRAFLFGRLGWSKINAMLIISGAFGLFRTDVVTAVGGYRANTIGEDMELVVRIHRMLRQQEKPTALSLYPNRCAGPKHPKTGKPSKTSVYAGSAACPKAWPATGG